MPPAPWKVISCKWDKFYRVFSLRTDRVCSPRTGEEHDFFILESPPWVNVIPLTDAGEVVLIRQYRHGLREVTLEIPGGLIEPGDTPEAAARRELREETGCTARTLIDLGHVHPNPAIQNNRCYTFLALGVTLAGAQELDEKEDIEVLFRLLTEIPAMIRDGRITHSLVIAAFYRYYQEYLPAQAGASHP